MLESKYLNENKKIISDLKKVPTLEPFSESDLNKLLSFSKLRKFKCGEQILIEGSYDGHIYILLYGSIRVVKKGKELTVLDRRGDIFGEMSLLGEFSRTASVFSNDEVVCLTIDNSTMDQLADSDKASIYYILYRRFAETLAERLKVTSEELIKTKSKYLKFW